LPVILIIKGRGSRQFFDLAFGRGYPAAGNRKCACPKLSGYAKLNSLVAEGG